MTEPRREFLLPSGALMRILEVMDEHAALAVQAERERCARIAERLACGFHSPWEYSADVAAAIRSAVVPQL